MDVGWVDKVMKNEHFFFENHGETMKHGVCVCVFLMGGLNEDIQYMGIFVGIYYIYIYDMTITNWQSVRAIMARVSSRYGSS